MCRLSALDLNPDKMAAARGCTDVAGGEIAQLAGQSLDRLAPADLAGADVPVAPMAAVEPAAQVSPLLKKRVLGPPTKATPPSSPA